MKRSSRVNGTINNRVDLNAKRRALKNLLLERGVFIPVHMGFGGNFFLNHNPSAVVQTVTTDKMESILARVKNPSITNDCRRIIAIVEYEKDGKPVEEVHKISTMIDTETNEILYFASCKLLASGRDAVHTFVLNNSVFC